MKIFAIGTTCPITKDGELFPRNCMFSNIQMGKKQMDKAFPELKCAYLEVKLYPKTKKATFQCLHKDSIMCIDDKQVYKGKRSK